MLSNSLRKHRPFALQSACAICRTVTKAARRTARQFKADSRTDRAVSQRPQLSGLASQLDVVKTDRTLAELWKPLVFTAGVGGCCFIGASVWQYERLKKNREFLFNRKYWNYETRIKYGCLRQKVHDMWQDLTFGQKTIISLVVANGIVFGAWRIRSLRSTMFRYFTCSFYGGHDLRFCVILAGIIVGFCVSYVYYISEKLCLPMVLSTFSHVSLFHLAINMYVLWTFGPAVVQNFMGLEQFIGFYLTAGAVSSLAGLAYKSVMRNPVCSIGASGAILAALMYTCCRIPDAQLSLVFFPFFTFSVTKAVVGMLTLDFCGLLFRWRLFDHAAHLGGSLFGIWYAYYGEKFWERRGWLIQKYVKAFDRSTI